MSLRLSALEGEQTIDVRPGTTLVVGRSPACDAPVIDGTVSRRHAELVADEAGGEVRDLGSSNGTYVNDARVERAALAAGDVVRFGKVRFRVGPMPEPVDPRVAPTTPLSAAAVRGTRTVMRPVFVASTAAHTPGNGTGLAGSTPPESREQRLRTLLEVSKQLTQAASVDALLAKIVDVCFRTFDVDRVALMLGVTADALTPKLARDRAGRALEGMVPLSIARSAVAERAGILSDDAPSDERFGGESVVVQQVRSALCAPLIGSDARVLGVLYVDNQALSHRFDEEDLDFLIAFAGIAGVAIENGEFAEQIRREALVRSNFERFFSPGLAERIATMPEGAAALAGDRRPVAVLFSDVRGFTPLSEHLAPEHIASLLTEYFTEMAECVFRHGGTLDKFLGDGLMALWGAPIAGPDDPDRAVRAAIDMMNALDVLNARWARVGRPALEVGIGINFGEAFAGNIGSARRLEYTVIGDVVNTASRLCACARGGVILVSEPLRAALSDARTLAALRPHEPLELRGKSRPVPVYSVGR
jgi:adenylate cyclase